MASLGAQTLNEHQVPKSWMGERGDKDVGRCQGDVDRGPSLPCKELRVS